MQCHASGESIRVVIGVRHYYGNGQVRFCAHGSGLAAGGYPFNNPSAQIE